MQPLLKYYNLESGSDGISELERGLKQHFRRKLRGYRELGDFIGGNFGSLVQELIIKTAENVDESSITDLGVKIFMDIPIEVLYQNSSLISTRWRFFAKRFAAETVVKGAAAALVDFEGYLEKNNFEIKESKVVSQAAFCISAGPEGYQAQIRSGIERLGKIITSDAWINRYKAVGCKLEYPVVVDGMKRLEGIFYGPVESVLSLKELLVEGEVLSVPLRTYGLRFE